MNLTVTERIYDFKSVAHRYPNNSFYIRDEPRKSSSQALEEQAEIAIPTF